MLCCGEEQNCLEFYRYRHEIICLLLFETLSSELQWETWNSERHQVQKLMEKQLRNELWSNFLQRLHWLASNLAEEPLTANLIFTFLLLQHKTNHEVVAKNWQHSGSKTRRRRRWKMTNSSFTLSRPNKISCCTRWVILRILIRNLFGRLTFNEKSMKRKKMGKTFSFISNRWEKVA